MVAVIEHHGLVAVPIDLDPASCAVNLDALVAAITPRTRAVVVAHLFGSRMRMDAVVELAQRHSLFLLEDCAQAFAADAYRGHAGSDVTLFSFGTIKTATAISVFMIV
jgi:dTDP-4-amino-4,6-dideoxygalactose transaminase